MGDSSSVVDFDELIRGGGGGGGGGGGEERVLPTPPRAERPEYRSLEDDRNDYGDAAPPPPMMMPRGSAGAASKTFARVLHSKWTWIAIGLVLAIGIGLGIAMIWFSQINKKTEAADVDKVNQQKKTACIVSVLCGAAVLGITLLVTKLTLKWK